MKVSIVIPTLNEAGCLANTLQALRAQGPHEILVADGGSTDRTRQGPAQREHAAHAHARQPGDLGVEGRGPHREPQRLPGHELLDVDDPIGPENDAWLGHLTMEVDLLVVGWGRR